MKKKKLSLFLCLAFIFIFQIPSYAETLEKPNIDTIKDSINEPELFDYYGWYEKSEVVGTTTKKVTVEPINQPSRGYRFNNGGSVGFYDEKGQDVSVSVTIASKLVDFTVKTGMYTKTGGSIMVNIPGNNKPHKVKLVKTYDVTLIKIDTYNKGEYVSTYYRTVENLAEVYGYSYEI